MITVQIRHLGDDSSKVMDAFGFSHVIQCKDFHTDADDIFRSRPSSPSPRGGIFSRSRPSSPSSSAQSSKSRYFVANSPAVFLSYFHCGFVMKYKYKYKYKNHSRQNQGILGSSITITAILSSTLIILDKRSNTIIGTIS